MKIRIQLFRWDNAQELKRRSKELRDFSKLLGLQLQKAEFDHYGNIFFVLLPKDDQKACLQINAINSFVVLNGHASDLQIDPPETSHVSSSPP